MESVDSDVNSADEEYSFLYDCDSANFDKKSGSTNTTTGFDETEDTRSELKFDEATESDAEKEKRARIETALSSNSTTLKTWQQLAIQDYGLVNDTPFIHNTAVLLAWQRGIDVLFSDDLRRKVWPLLLEVDPSTSEKAPSLADLSNHSEYNQVVLDVNRSLKRFPPGIPYKQRLALQDQLTVLILRVIMKHPHLRYYQGYHDVAITFLLVVGEAVAFRIMDRLSTDHLRECMEPTMERTSYRLTFMYSLFQKVDRDLHDYMERASVGIMFALPWYLTWFGHSLNQYRDVVRLYDYFLASPPLMPLYVAASVVIQRRQEVFEADCEMASIHCLLSQIPDDLDFEEILRRASTLYKKYPPEKLEKDVKRRVQKELEQRRREELRVRRRLNRNKPIWYRLTDFIPLWLMLHYKTKYGILFATATVLFGFYAYLKATEGNTSIFRGRLGNT